MKTAFGAHAAVVEEYSKLRYFEWKPHADFHVHVDFPSGEDACWGTHPKTKILKNGRKMPLVERGTGPRVDPFAKGGKGRYERKANLDPAR
jgi:hypothetical protein